MVRNSGKIERKQRRKERVAGVVCGEGSWVAMQGGRVRKKRNKNEEKGNLVGFGDKDTFISRN